MVEVPGQVERTSPGAPDPAPGAAPGSAPGPAPDKAPEAAPTTGIADIDRVTSGLTELERLPLSEHPDRLQAAHTALVEALQADPMEATAVQQGDPGSDHDAARS